MVNQDNKFMSLALKLARQGRGSVEPNPMVGAVIVRDGEEIARGWHKKFGGPHAEIEALKEAEAAGEDVRGATMYVTLEPCCHHGKTPPCSEAIIEAGLRKVVVAMEDPDKNVAGGGNAMLCNSGVEVLVGVCAQEARKLLAAYIKLRNQKRPWVICKWAQTSDGYIALPPEEGRWISSPQSREYVHELRGLVDGICVGIGTVLADDPLLTNRSDSGKQPTRLILDSQLIIPQDCQLVKTAEFSPVIVATTKEAVDANADKADSLKNAGVEVLSLPAGAVGIDTSALLDELGKRKWTHLLVEGGSKVLDNFIFSDLADELLVFICSMKASEDWQGLPRFDISDVCQELDLTETQQEEIGGDILKRFILSR